MNCTKCGAPLEADAKFCVACGTPIDETPVEAPMADETPAEAPAVDAPKAQAVAAEAKEVATAVVNETVNKVKKMDKKQLITLIVGSIIILIGFITVFSAGTTISSTSFGADFYTYAYRGIVAISEILAKIHAALGWIIVAIGAAIDLSAFRK